MKVRSESKRQPIVMIRPPPVETLAADHESGICLQFSALKSHIVKVA